MKVIIHIGMPKTGSTSLQCVLFNNKAKLQEQKVVYEPDFFHEKFINDICGSRLNDGRMHHAFIAAFKRDPDAVGEVLLERLKKFGDCRYYILSSEDFVHNFSERDIAALASCLQGCEVDVVLWVRRQDDLLDAIYKQRVIAGVFVEKDIDVDLDYEGIIRRWENILECNVKVFKYDGENTVRDFSRCYDIELENDAVRYNTGRSRNCIEIADRIIKNSDIEYMSMTPVLDALEDIETPPASSRIYTLEERKAILARYEAGNRAIAKRFFGEESLFAPLPEVEPDAAPYPSLGVDDAFRMLKKLFAHQIYSDVRLKILMRYIEAHGDFDADFYRREYMRGESPDASPLEHFVRFGMYRHFKPNPSFEEELAFLACPRLKENGIPPYIAWLLCWTDADKLLRYVEARGDFDEDFYRREYVRGRKEICPPLEHFVRFGMNRGLRPNASFDAEAVWKKCPGLRESGISPYIVHLVLSEAEKSSRS